MSPHTTLAIVPKSTTSAERAAALYAETRQAASDHTQELFDAMAETMRLAHEVGVGSDAYPAGLRDCARRLALHLKHVGDTMTAVAR